jgi:M6 family metalloprotease-like protein
MEVKVNKLLTIFALASVLYAGKMTIVRDNFQHIPYYPPAADFTLQLVGDYSTQTVRYQPHRPFDLFSTGYTAPQPFAAVPGQRLDLNILVLRVEFIEDEDTFTTGNGKMDLEGNGDFSTDGLFYDPPHTRTYFERHMQFLSNFFKSNSYGNLNVTFDVKPDGLNDSYQIPHNMGYYSGFDHYDSETGFVFFNVYALEMGLIRVFMDGIAAADQDPIVDFSQYDAVIIFHAGAGLETSLSFYRFRDLWSATFGPAALDFYMGTPYVIANNGADTIDCPVMIVPEMERVDDYMVGVIGTVCHEFGHVLGLPDLYDVSGWSNGIGAWGLMGTGAWIGSPRDGVPEGTIPAYLSAWSRSVMGWGTPRIMHDADSLISIRAAEIDTTQYDVDTMTMVTIPVSETEYFIIENRQQDILQKDTILIDQEDSVVVSVDYGEYDFFLPGSGILVWHVDDAVLSSWADSGYNYVQINPYHKGVDLEEADGIQHFDAWWYGDTLEYYGSRFDAFFVDDSAHANHYFGPFSNPNSDSYYGKSLVTVDTKSPPDTTMNIAVDFDIYQDGFPVTAALGHAVQAVSHGDLDGNGEQELIVATSSGRIYAFHHDGTQYGFAVFDTIMTYLSVSDINADGADDILFATGFDLYCLDGHTLTALPNFPFTADNDILGAPLLFDIDEDGTDEIIFGSKDRLLYCIDSTATNVPGFPDTLTTEIVSTPCVFDQETRKIGVLGSNGLFWIIDQAGIVRRFEDSQHNIITFASPVAGDLDRDGEPEAVIVNGYGTIYIYGADTLEHTFDILIDTTFYITPALADIDDDGYLEIIMPNSSRTLFVTNRNGISENDFPFQTGEYIYQPLIVADLDNNATDELIFGMAVADSFGTGQMKIINNRNTEFPYSPLFGDGGFTSPGIVLDLDNDGDLELACGSDMGKLYVWDFPGIDAEWCGYMNSPKNWGIYTGALPDPQVPSTLIGSFYIYPSPVETYGTVRFFLGEDAEVTVEILDIVGHSIGKIDLENTIPNEYNEVTFSFEKQSNGVYIARVEARSSTRRDVKFKKFAVLR